MEQISFADRYLKAMDIAPPSSNPAMALACRELDTYDLRNRADDETNRDNRYDIMRLSWDDFGVRSCSLGLVKTKGGLSVEYFGVFESAASAISYTTYFLPFRS